MWAYNASGPWTNKHQMSVGGKRDNFDRADLIKTANDFGIRRPADIIDAVIDAVRKWPELAAALRIPEARIAEVRATHRLNL
jgi:serine/threonine-protein kinase HipA